LTCTYDWFFANPPVACPGQPPKYSLTVAQHFERGLMLWRERPDLYGSQIYVFFGDNTWPYWNPTNDRWRPGMPESDSAIVPPPGYYQPVRGFGVFWRETFFGLVGQSARDRLGWATEEEFSLGELPMQCHANDGRLPGCYLAGPNNVVYVIGPENSWSIWEGPTAVSAPVISTPVTVPVTLEPESPDCTSEELAEIVWPQLYKVQLVETAIGAEVQVIGSGGYLYWGGKCGQRYDESSRSFPLYVDGEAVDAINCYGNHCQATLSVAADALVGIHTIAVEGGSSISVQISRD
jgi:hypothetical protein